MIQELGPRQLLSLCVLALILLLASSVPVGDSVSVTLFSVPLCVRLSESVTLSAWLLCGVMTPPSLFLCLSLCVPRGGQRSDGTIPARVAKPSK